MGFAEFSPPAFPFAVVNLNKVIGHLYESSRTQVVQTAEKLFMFFHLFLIPGSWQLTVVFRFDRVLRSDLLLQIQKIPLELNQHSHENRLHWNWHGGISHGLSVVLRPVKKPVPDFLTFPPPQRGPSRLTP